MKQSVGKQLTAGTANTLFTVPAGYKAIVSMLFISNLDANNKTTSAQWHQADTSTNIYIIQQYPMASHTYIQFSNGELVLQSGDSMVITPEAGATQSALATFDLIKQGTVPYIAYS